MQQHSCGATAVNSQHVRVKLQYPTAHCDCPFAEHTLAIALQFATANMMGAPNAPPGHKDQLYLNVRCCSASRLAKRRDAAARWHGERHGSRQRLAEPALTAATLCAVLCGRASAPLARRSARRMVRRCHLELAASARLSRSDAGLPVQLRMQRWLRAQRTHYWAAGHRSAWHGLRQPGRRPACRPPPTVCDRSR